MTLTLIRSIEFDTSLFIQPGHTRPNLLTTPKPLVLLYHANLLKIPHTRIIIPNFYTLFTVDVRDEHGIGIIFACIFEIFCKFAR